MSDATFADLDSPLPRRAGIDRGSDVTHGFCLIKLMAVTMGETTADFLAVNHGLGLGATPVLMRAVLVAAMGWQFRKRGDVPAIHRIAFVPISVVGTLITDNMTEATGKP